jgi:hypothetical protein
VVSAALLCLVPWYLLLRAGRHRRAFDRVRMGGPRGDLFEVYEPPPWKPWRLLRRALAREVGTVVVLSPRGLIHVRCLRVTGWSHPRIPSPAVRPGRNPRH